MKRPDKRVRLDKIFWRDRYLKIFGHQKLKVGLSVRLRRERLNGYNPKALMGLMGVPTIVAINTVSVRISYYQGESVIPYKKGTLGARFCMKDFEVVLPRSDSI